MAKSQVSDNLADLISSLTTNEKRYFKISAGEDSDKNYIRLFNEIDTGKTSPGQEKKHPAHSKVKPADERAYLKKMIFRSLRNFHEDQSVATSLHQTIIEVEILYKKNLLDMALRIVRKAKTLAIENEFYIVLLNLIRWQRDVMSHLDMFHNMLDEYDALRQGEAECLKKLESENAYNDLQARLLVVSAHKGNITGVKEEKALKAIAGHPYMKDESMALTFMAKARFYSNWSMYYILSNNSERAAATNKRFIAFMEQHPEAMATKLQLYIVTLINTGWLYESLGDMENVWKVINKLEEVLAGKKTKLSILNEKVARSSQVELKMSYFTYSMQYDKGILLFNEILANVKTKNLELHISVMHWLYMLVGVCNFYTGRYNRALENLRVFLNNPEDEDRTDYLLFAQLLHVMIQFELKNYQMIPYMIRSINRYVLSRGFHLESVALFLKMFAQLAKKNDDRQVTDTVNSFLPRLEALNRNTDEKTAINSVLLFEWMKSKLKRR